MVQGCFLSQGKIQKLLDLRCWDGAHRRVLAVSTFVCLRLTTCADRASAIPGSPPTHAALCQAAHQEKEGVQMCRQNRGLLSQDRCCPPLVSLPLLALQALPCLVHLPECAAPTPAGQPESQPCLFQGAALSQPSPAHSWWGPWALREPWRFSNCACTSPGPGKTSMSHPLPGLLILLQITGRTLQYFPAPSLPNCPGPGCSFPFLRALGVLTQWGSPLQCRPGLWPLLQPARSLLSLRK